MTERLPDDELARLQDMLDSTDVRYFEMPVSGFLNAREPANGIQIRTAKLRSLVAEVRAARELLARHERLMREAEAVALKRPHDGSQMDEDLEGLLMAVRAIQGRGFASK